MKPSGTNDLPRDRSELIKLAKLQGWEVTRNSLHMVVRNPANGKAANMSFNPSDNYGGVHVFRDELKKAGLLSNDEFRKKQVRKNPPPPKMVVDRSPNQSMGEQLARIITVSPKPMVRGAIRDAILAAMGRVGDSPNGRSADDILGHVKAYVPDMDKTRLNVAMNGYTKSGLLERVGVGHFRVVPDGAKPKVIPSNTESVRRAPALPPMPPTVLDMDTTQDVREMDEILGVLSNHMDQITNVLVKFERIIRKHQDIARGLAPLKALITAMTNVPAPAPVQECTPPESPSEPEGGDQLG